MTSKKASFFFLKVWFQISGPCNSFIGQTSQEVKIAEDDWYMLWNWGGAGWWIALVSWIPYIFVIGWMCVPPEQPSGFVYRS